MKRPGISVDEAVRRLRELRAQGHPYSCQCHGGSIGRWSCRELRCIILGSSQWREVYEPGNQAADNVLAAAAQELAEAEPDVPSPSWTTRRR